MKQRRLPGLWLLALISMAWLPVKQADFVRDDDKGKTGHPGTERSRRATCRTNICMVSYGD
jgi:hypothetical protein